MTIMNREKCAVFVGVVLLLTAGLWASQDRSSQCCACMEFEETLQSLSILSRVEWQPLARDQLAQLWPAVSCDRMTSSEEFRKSSCDTCGTCGAQMADRGAATTVLLLAEDCTSAQWDVYYFRNGSEWVRESEPQ